MNTRIEKFEDLRVWQNAMELSVKIYDTFKLCKDHGLSIKLYG